MYMSLQPVTDDVRSLMDIFQQLDTNGSLPFEDELKLFNLFTSLKNTNSIIRVAQMTVKIDADKLYSDAQVLSETSSAATDAYFNVSGKLLAINFMADCKAYLKPFDDELSEQRKIATELWQEYTSRSNRLDYMDMDSDEFKALDAECDAAKAKYDEFHAKLSKLNDAFDKKRREIGVISFFDPSLISVVLIRIKQIADSIISDIEQGRKEECR